MQAIHYFCSSPSLSLSLLVAFVLVSKEVSKFNFFEFKNFILFSKKIFFLLLKYKPKKINQIHADDVVFLCFV